MAPDTHSKEGALITKLAASGANVVSVDHTLPISAARELLDEAGYESVGLQGNLDPAILAEGSEEEIVAAAQE